jgi:hypothetical protein
MVNDNIFKIYNNIIPLYLKIFILNDLSLRIDKEWFLNKVLTNHNNIIITIEIEEQIIGYSILKLDENKISRLKIFLINKGYGVKLLNFIIKNYFNIEKINFYCENEHFSFYKKYAYKNGIVYKEIIDNKHYFGNYNLNIQNYI